MTIPGWLAPAWHGTWFREAMPSRPQTGLAGHAFHAMNRCQPNELLFDTPQAYRAFIGLTAEVHAATGIRILASCLMPNHWHFVLWPSEDDQLTKFVGSIAQTHAKRLRRWRGTEGGGPVYPDRFLAKPLPAELNLFRAMRYVERNPVRARLAQRAEEWPWSSASRGAQARIPVTPWPDGKTDDWLAFVNQEEGSNELEDLRAQMYERREWKGSR